MVLNARSAGRRVGSHAGLTRCVVRFAAADARQARYRAGCDAALTCRVRRLGCCQEGAVHSKQEQQDHRQRR